MTHEKEQILHFTLGPVQGFIEDARRTRDFWAGSFLLSWLSGQAMAAVIDHGGEIIFPNVEGDELFQAIRGKKNTYPYIGSLPNRFKARVPEGLDVEGVCKKAIDDNWEEIAKKVWDQFIKGEVAKLGKGGEKSVKDIWDRQVNNFWDINWVLGNEADDDGKWLDQRKNWRTYLRLDEGGDLCRLMGHYQEISGFHRINGKNDQKKFWDKLRKKGNVGELNIADDECLCSIALIKRLYPLIAKDTIGWNPGGNRLSVINWPSVSYIAAVPWLRAVSDDQSKEYADIVKGKFKGETETNLFDLPNEGIFNLDGHLLHVDGILSLPEDILKKEEARSELLGGLKKIKKKLDCYASEFYAVLIMDGDRIGSKIGSHEEIVANGLAKFTSSVKEYFDPESGDKNPSNGVLIYAGGDDVLAFLPVDTAIEAAIELRKRYNDAFEEAIGKSKQNDVKGKDFTMSGAIIYTQYKIPLRAVLEKAHHYIDKIAKDKNGRNGLAIAVMKPGGIAYDWVSCWANNDHDPIRALNSIAKNREKYSSSFFYNVRERYTPLFYGDDPRGDNSKDIEESNVFAEDIGLVEAILTAEYKKQFGSKKLKNSEVKDAVGRLLEIGKPLSVAKGECKQSKQYNFNGVLVARFLSEEGRWHLNNDVSKGGKEDE